MITEPSPDCPFCPRLVAFREVQRIAHPEWFNAPVPPFGDPDAWLAVVGLAPGLKGANRTGRPFTGDGSGAILFDAMQRLGLAEGAYGGETADGLRLNGVAIVNAVRCVPPGNKPTPEEMRNCRPFLEGALAGLPKLRVVLALGQIAHQSAIKALGGKLPKARFAHGAEHRLPSGMIVLDSYHCSRLNQNVGLIDTAMLEAVLARSVAHRGVGDMMEMP
jgi:uracil-DNA glycosylase family 4